MASEDILLEAKGDASNLESEFEGAAEVVERSMDDAQRAIESVDASSLADAGADLGDALVDGSERAGSALSELSNQLDDVATSARDGASAAGEAADAQQQIEDTAGSAATAIQELADAEEALAESQRSVGESSGQAADGTRQAADAADLLSTATRNAADSGSEAGQRIRDAFEAIVNSTGDVTDGVHAAEQAFEALGGSPSEFIGATNNDLEKQVLLLADLQKNVRQLDEESREGLGGFADRAAKVSQRVAELEALIEKQGDQSLPQVRQELERLRQQYRKTFDEGAQRAANLEVEIEQNEDALKRMKLEAQGSAGEIVDLTEALRLRFPAAAKGIASAVSAVVAFQAAFQGTRQFIEFLERDFGIGVDKFITRVAGLEDVADSMVGSTQSVREALERVGSQLKILDSTGVDVDELRRRHEDLQRQLSDNSGALAAAGTLQEFGAANRETAETTENVSKFVKEADKAWAGYSETQKKVGTDASAATKALEALQERALGVDVDDLTEQYGGLADAFRELKDRGDEFRDSPVLTQFAKEVSEVRESLEALPPELENLFKRATGTSASDALAQIDAMAESLDLVGLQSEKAGEKSKKAAEEAGKAWADAATSTSDAWAKVEAQLLGLGDVADDAAPSADGSGLTQDLEAARQQLAQLEDELQGIRDQSLISLGDVNRESELLQDIGRARQELSLLEREASSVPLNLDAGPARASAEAAGRDIGNSLKEALRSSGFVDAFRELQPQVQQEVSALISELDRLASSSDVLDPSLVISYGQAIRQALGGDAVSAIQGLGGALGGIPASGADTVDTLLAIARASRESAGGAGELSAQVNELSTAAGEGTIKFSKTGETIAEIGKAARDASSDASAAASGVGDLGSAAEDTAAAADGARIKIEGAGDSVRIIRTEADGVAASAPAAAEAIGQMGEAAATSAPPVQVLAEAAMKAAGHMAATADAADRVAAAEDVGPRVEEIATAATAASPAIGELADHTLRLAEGLSTALQQGEDLPTILEALGSAVESLGPPLEAHRETVDAVGEGYTATASGAERITEAEGLLAIALETTNEGLAATEQRLSTLNPQLSEFEEKVGGVEERLLSLAQQADGTAESLERLVSPETLQGLGELATLLANATGEAGRLADELERADRAAEAVTS